MTNKEPMKSRRLVKQYKRKLANNKMQNVKEYIQSYDSPRGIIMGVTPDNLTKHSQTIWLKNRAGHFVGRANYEGKTAAKNISKFGYDETSVVRDTRRYKRIFGRIGQSRRRTRR